MDKLPEYGEMMAGALVMDKLPKECRTRILDIRKKKGLWKAEETTQMVKLIQKYGRNWSLISKHLPN